MPTRKSSSADDAESPSCHANAKHQARVTTGTYAPSGNERNSFFMNVQGRLTAACHAVVVDAGERSPPDPIDDWTRRAANQPERQELVPDLARPPDQYQSNELRSRHAHV